MIINGDSLHELKHLPADSIDFVCTDPPYGYSFMGKDWDRAVPSVEIWQECLRVLKPGAFCCVMSAPRSDVQNAMISRLMEAGFRLDFTPIYWTYASGFPKATNIGKTVDKRLGVERTVVSSHKTKDIRRNVAADIEAGKTDRQGKFAPGSPTQYMDYEVTTATSPQAKQLDGSYAGFQPKPAVEVIIVAMKPLSEKTYVDQALANGHGVSWLDSVRIPCSDVSAPELSLDSFDGNDVGSLLKACEIVRDCSLPTISCSKSCTTHDRHAFDDDCSWGIGLRQWLSACLRGDGEHEKPDLELSSSPADCPTCSHFRDELSQPEVRDDLGVTPLPDDALADICHFLQEHSDIHSSLCTVLLANCGALHQLVHSYCNYTRNGQNKIGGRFPANLLVSDDVLNDGVERASHGGGDRRSTGKAKSNVYGKYAPAIDNMPKPYDLKDSGSYSRYFDLDKWATTLPFLITPKASKREKNTGLDDRETVTVGDGRQKSIDNAFQRGQTERLNSHPTVKPLRLMSYLITLFSRPGDTVLDPFVGSGTTCVAAKQLDRECIGIEREAEYAEIATARLAHITPQLAPEQPVEGVPPVTIPQLTKPIQASLF